VRGQGEGERGDKERGDKARGDRARGDKATFAYRVSGLNGVYHCSKTSPRPL